MVRRLLSVVVVCLVATSCQYITTVVGPGYLAPADGVRSLDATASAELGIDAHPQGGVVFSGFSGVYWSQPNGTIEVLSTGLRGNVDIGTDGTVYFPGPFGEGVAARRPDGSLEQIVDGSYRAVHLAPNGQLYALRWQDGKIGRIINGVFEPVPWAPAAGGVFGDRFAVESDGSILVPRDTQVLRYRQTGSEVVYSGGSPRDIDVMPSGAILVADAGKHQVFRVDRDGTATVVAGTGSPGFSGEGAGPLKAKLSSPGAVSAVSDKAFYIADGGGNDGRIRLVSSAKTTRRYVALGDSFSAGTGARPWTDPNPDCQRSKDAAYPNLLAGRADFPANVTFVACVGARIRDMTGSQKDDDGNIIQGPQLDAIAPPGQSDDTVVAVTISIGGNDIFGDGLDDLLTKCLLWTCGTSDDSSETWNRFFDMGLGGVPERDLGALLREIRRRAPVATIYIVGYPYLFSNNFFGCGSVNSEEVEWLNSLVDLSYGLYDYVAGSFGGVEVVDLRPTFAGRENCGADEPHFINGLIAAIDWRPFSTASFHPNADGNRAMADAIEAASEAN